MAEWSNAPDLKSGLVNSQRGFESHPLRFLESELRSEKLPIPIVGIGNFLSIILLCPQATKLLGLDFGVGTGRENKRHYDGYRSSSLRTFRNLPVYIQ